MSNLQILAKHLQGRHNQSSHGRGKKATRSTVVHTARQTMAAADKSIQKKFNVQRDPDRSGRKLSTYVGIPRKEAEFWLTSQGFNMTLRTPQTTYFEKDYVYAHAKDQTVSIGRT